METLYDVVQYPGSPHGQAHIRRLAAMATLFGMSPPDTNNCRVLELGCGDGAHLLPMAVAYPNAQFVGIDASKRAITRANELVVAAGLNNISFREGDIAHLSGRPGECDYLIAHGVFSWVPAPVQEAILDLCSRVLSDNGVAYISYNAYPGWHVRMLSAELMRRHLKGMTDPKQMFEEGMGLLATIARSLTEKETYAEMLRTEIERLSERSPWVLFHDELDSVTTPFYFSDFVERAQRHGLQYLSQAEFLSMQYDQLAEEARNVLNSFEDFVKREQYLDYFKLRFFRQDLLCRAGASVSRSHVKENLRRLYFAASVSPVDGSPSLHDDSHLQFVTQLQVAATVSQPFVKAVLLELGAAWPARLSFGQLLKRALARVPIPPAQPDEMLCDLLLRLWTPPLLEVDVTPYPFALSVSERPAAAPLSRIQAKIGLDVTTLRHVVVTLDDEKARTLVQLLDGSRNHQELQKRVGVDSHELDIMLKRLCDLSLLVA